MKSHDMKHLRNIGIMAHIDAGKTTTTERILYYTGLTHKIGEVHDGSAVMDWMEQEQERGITITSAATTCIWKDYQINLIDTPGHVDFTVEVERCLRILDSAVFLLDAKEGVEAQTKVVWHQGNVYQVPRLIFVNKMDMIGADYEASIKSVRKELKATPLPIQIPIGKEKDFQGVISLITMKAYYNQGNLGEELIEKDIPDDYLLQAQEARNDFIEALADVDDDIMMAYLESEDISKSQLLRAIRQATINQSVVPILCGSAFKNKSVQLLLNAILDFLPSPLDRPIIAGHTKNGEEISRKPDPTEPFSGLIFKIMSDPFVGRLAYLRIYSGTIKAGKPLLNVSRDKKVRPNKLLHMHANHRKEIDEAYAGDIIAAIGLKFTGTGNTLADMSHPILLESIEFPEPVISRVVEPKKTGDYDKMREALDQLVEEDPTLASYLDSETGQNIISGMGELHLEIVLDRLDKEFNVKVNSGKPQVNYKETITQPVRVNYELTDLGGKESVYAAVSITVSPKERGTGHSIDMKLPDQYYPKSYQESVEKGIKQSLVSGIIGGYELIDLHVEVTNLDYRDDSSSDIAFLTAGARALGQALKEGNSKLLEPIFSVNIHIPENYVGDIIDDIKRRKGDIISMELLHGNHQVLASVPLSKLFGYASDLRSMTRGNGHYTILFSHYDFVST